MAIKGCIENFIKESKNRFPNKFSYEHAVYISSKTKLKIRCLLHNLVFEVTPSAHLHKRGKGSCPLCKIDAIIAEHTYTTDMFIDKAKVLHGNCFDYSCVNYISSDIKVQIKCTKCKKYFAQNPHNHLTGHGCPHCIVFGYKRNKPAWLYLLCAEDLVKIGISNDLPKKRASLINSKSKKNFKVFCCWEFVEGTTPENIEQSILKELRQKYEQPKEKFDGSTECFYDLDPEYLKHLIEQRIRELNILNNEQNTKECEAYQPLETA